MAVNLDTSGIYFPHAGRPTLCHGRRRAPYDVATRQMMRKNLQPKAHRQQHAAEPVTRHSASPTKEHLLQRLHSLEREIQTLHTARSGAPARIPWWARDWEAAPADQLA
jgi:hypothetical protein